ncbi:hypothetical protein [Mycobacterium servetii]|uniref:Uncharacterized protein n=1 Tax=Mycobacterium servetii TaxID=3237418 RepID=A0ABV4C8I1_9MYCO
MRSSGAHGIRRALARPVSVAAALELATWLALPYLATGAAWAFVHPDRLRELETAWEKAVPAGAQIAAFGEAAALWPALLLLPTDCSAR